MGRGGGSTAEVMVGRGVVVGEGAAEGGKAVVQHLEGGGGAHAAKGRGVVYASHSGGW